MKTTRLASILLLVILPLLGRGQRLLFQRITTADGLSNNQVQHVEQLDDGQMLMLTFRGVNIYDGAHVTAYPRIDEHTMLLPHSRFTCKTLVSRTGRLWIKEWGRLWCFDLKNRQVQPRPDSLLRSLAHGPVGEIVDLWCDRASGKTRLLSAEGLAEAATGQTVQLPFDAELLADVEADAEGRPLLFCTDGSVWCCQNEMRQITCEGVPQALPLDFKVLRGSDGRYYRQLYYKGYSRIDEFNLHTMQWRQMIESQMVLYFMSLPDGHRLAVGSRHGIFEIPLDETPSPFDCLQAAPLPAGVVAHLPVRFHSTFGMDNGETLHDISVMHATVDRRGGLWLATGDLGVLYAHPSRHRFASSGDWRELRINEPTVWSLHEKQERFFRHFPNRQDNDCLTDRKGRLWRATHNGIFVTGCGDSLHLGTSDGLSSNFVQSLIEDDKGRVWVATNRGISCIEDTKPLRIVKYGVHDGVPDWDAKVGQSAFLPDGRIAMQFAQGWVAFHPDSVQRPHYELAPVLVGASPSANRMAYNDNDVSLSFSTDNYAFPRSVRYQWRIAGKSDWKEGTPAEVSDGQLHLNLTHLPPGKYVVEARAAIDNYSYNGGICQNSFTILPPWWLTWWAYTLYTLCALATATAIVGLYVRRRQDALKQKMREESLLQQIEMLMQQTHFTAEQPLQRETVEEEKEEGGELAPEEGLLPQESEFVQRAISLVNQHIAENYTVEQMAADLCMERTGLYKRLTALVNQSPQIFIRSIRLNRALEMMQAGESITSAAYGAGFNSVSYFGRCFAKEFGCSPSDYLKGRSAN